MILLADSEDPDQTAYPRSLLWAFAVRTQPEVTFLPSRAALILIHYFCVKYRDTNTVTIIHVIIIIIIIIIIINKFDKQYTTRLDEKSKCYGEPMRTFTIRTKNHWLVYM